jgi:hypothetical protein
LYFLEEFERLQDDLRCHLGEVIVRHLFAAHLAGVGDVGGGLKLSALPPANVIYDHIVVLDAFRFACDAVERRYDLQRLDVQAGLFLQLAPHAFRQFLTEFEHAARNGPLALQRLATAANQESPPTVDDDSADAYDGTIWIFALHLCY